MQEISLDQQVQAVRQCISELTREPLAGSGNSASPGNLLCAAESLAGAAARADEERQQFRDLIGSSTDGFVVTDADGRIVEANAAAASLLGEPLPGTFFAAYGSRDAQPEIARMLADLCAEKACAPRETTLRSRSGVPVPVTITAAGRGAGEKRWLIQERPRENPALLERIGGIYRLLFDRMLEGIYVFAIVRDADGRPVDYRYIDVNPEGLKLIGRRHEEVIGKSVSEVFPEMHKFLQNLFCRVAETGEPEHVEQPSPALFRHLDVTLYRPQRDLLALLAYDITDRKRMEEELRIQQQRLELALSAARMIVWDWNPTTGRLRISGDFEEIYGRPPFARPGERLALVHPDDMNGLRSEEEQSGLYHTDYRIVRPDTGAVAWLESRGEVQKDEAGNVTRAVGVTMDITGQKQSRQALEHQQELLQGVIDTIPVMIAIYDPDLRFFRLNREFQRVLGWSDEDGARGDLMARFFPDPDYRNIADDYMRSLKPGWRDLLLVAKDGSVVETAWANIRLSDDTRVGIGIDIRERKRAEAALLESEGRFRALLNASPNVVMLIDRAGTILALNEVVAERFGRGLQELMGRSIFEILPPDVAARRKAIIEEVFLTGRPVRCVDEREGMVLYNSLFPVADAEGNVVRVAVISYDITEQRRFEEMRRQAFTQIEQNIEQFAVLGDHIRLPLQVILGTADLLDDEQASERIRKQIWRINDIVEQLDRGWVKSREIREFLRRHELV